jgi:hypothetical protein
MRKEDAELILDFVNDYGTAIYKAGETFAIEDTYTSERAMNRAKNAYNAIVRLLDQECK